MGTVRYGTLTITRQERNFHCKFYKFFKQVASKWENIDKLNLIFFTYCNIDEKAFNSSIFNCRVFAFEKITKNTVMPRY